MVPNPGAGTSSCLQHTVALFKSRNCCLYTVLNLSGKMRLGLCGFLWWLLLLMPTGLSTMVSEEEGLDAKLLALSCASFLFSSLSLCSSWLADNFPRYRKPDKEIIICFVIPQTIGIKQRLHVLLWNPIKISRRSPDLYSEMNVFAASLGPQKKSLAVCT